MFHDWKVGQQGWVRLRNGKIGRATVCSSSKKSRSHRNNRLGDRLDNATRDGSDVDCVRVDYIKDAHVSWFWISRSGHYHAGNGDSTNDAIEHLPDCTGFDWEPKFKVGDWVRIISHERWCDDAKKDRPIGSYRKIATISFMSRELKLETASRWKFFMFDHFEPFVYRVGDWVQVNTTNSRDLEHPQGAIRRIRAIEQRGFGKFFFFDGFNFGVFDTDVIPIDQLPSIIWQLSAKVRVVSR